MNKHRTIIWLEVDIMSKLRHLLVRARANEYVKSLVFVVIILGSILAFWFGLRTALATNYPLLAVASGSMVPTLNVGDLIVVQGGLTVNDVKAEYEVGDIIVFRKPENPDELIVHRAVEKVNSSSSLYIRTKGDHNTSTDPWRIYDSHLVGKVVGALPYVGHIPLFVHTQQGTLIIVILIAVLIIFEFALPFIKNQRKLEPSETEKNTSDLSS